MFTLADYLPLINMIGFVFLGIAYIIVQYRMGSNKASSDVILAYKEQVSLNSNQITDLTHELGVLTGQLKEKDERIKLLEALVQGRNPEQLQYMNDMRKFTEAVAEYMASSTKTLGEVSVFMHGLNNK